MWYDIERTNAVDMACGNSSRIAELDIYVPQGSKLHSFHLGVELRCSRQDVDDDDISFVFGIRKARLILRLENCCIPAGTPRFGDDQPPPVSRRSISRESEFQREGARSRLMEGSLGIEAAKAKGVLSAKFGCSSKLQQKNKESITDEETVWFVRSSTKNTWEIQDPEESWLCRKYLGDEALCIIETSDLPFELRAWLCARPKELDVDDIKDKSWFKLLSKNKQKIIKLAITKHEFTYDEYSNSFIIDEIKLKSANGYADEG